MTTSVIDYIFRELAVTYMGRDDLAHVGPEEILQRTLRPTDGSGEELTDPLPQKPAAKLSDDVPEKVSAKIGKTSDGTRTESDYERAKQMGYTGDACGECGSMTMVRNGTCLKCNTCGATSGCS